MPLLLLLALVLLLAACGGSDGNANTVTPSSTQPSSTTQAESQPNTTTVVPGDLPEELAEEKEYGGTVRMVVTVDTAYPFGLPWNSAANIATQVQVPFSETLVNQYSRGVCLPALASDFEVDAEKEEIRFKLREDVHFSDGTKFNAEVAVWNIYKQIEVNAANPAITGAEVRGEYEFALLMTGSFSNSVLNALAGRGYGMTSKENYDKVGADAAGEYPVCTGPFLLKEKVPGSKVVFEKNPTYWVPGKPYLDTFEYHSILDVMTQTAAMLSKDENDRIDVLMQNNIEQLKILTQDPEIELVTYPSGYSSIYPSSKNPDSPFAKLEVRQAVAYAIDRQLICDARGFGVLTPATQMMVNGFMGWFDDGRNYYPFDPEKSKELLTQAGYPDGFSSTIIASASSDRDVVVAIQSMLNDVGIKCELQFPESGLYTELRTVSGWEGLVYGGFTNISSMTNTYGVQLDPDYRYYISTWRPLDEMLPLYNASRVTPVQDNGLFQDLHALMADNMVIIPIISSNTSFVVNRAVRDGGFGYYGLGTIFLPEEIWRSTK